MEYLASHRRVVPLSEILDRRADPGPPRVAITFDDGYQNVLEHGLPTMLRLGLPATFFVASRWIGSTRGWGSEDGLELGIMDEDELRALEASGFAIESHGHAHIDYARSEPAAVRDDVRASVERLGAILGRAPRHLAYPYGRVTEAAADEAARQGMRAGFVLDRPQEIQGDFAVGRVSIVPADGRALYAIKTADRYSGWRHSRPVRAAYRVVRPIVRNRWLWP
jgi:peptidoglycan/xylan/chitin deacetylase (PgdA/CDA1 family)